MPELLQPDIGRTEPSQTWFMFRRYLILGYVPWECPEDPVGRLVNFKKVRELSFKWHGELMNQNPEQLSDWLAGRNVPIERNQRVIAEFLDAYHEKENSEEQKD